MLKSWPIAGLKPFTGEVATVVLGVFLALVAQEWVEDRALEKHLRFTEAALTLEVGAAFYAAHERLAIDPCLKARLLSLDQKLASGANQWIGDPIIPAETGPMELAAAYGSPIRLWATNTWETATATDALVAMSHDRVNLYSRAFAMIALLRQGQQKEADLARHIDHLARDEQIDPSLRTGTIAGISALFHNREIMLLASRQLIDLVRELELEITPARIAIMNQELQGTQAFFGACSRPYKIG